jgi:hypothetical protein
MYSPDRRRSSNERKPETYSPDTWDNPAKVISDLKKFGLTTLKLSGRFVRNLINKLR